MGIYINMEMPTRCGRCDMCITEVDGNIGAHKECCITGAIIDNLGEKMEDCPLVPAANVQPVVRGKWKLNNDGSGTCSVCHFTQSSVWDDDGWQNFCGHCGADMRGFGNGESET